jgi:hypothetical protein
VAVLYGQPEAVGLTDTICDQEGTFLHRAAVVESRGVSGRRWSGQRP